MDKFEATVFAPEIQIHSVDELMELINEHPLGFNNQNIGVHPVDELMALSKQYHLGFDYMGERPPLMVPEEQEDFIWYPEPMFPKPIHKEAIRRHELVMEELPGIEIVQVIIGDEIEKEPRRDWEADAQKVEAQVRAGAEEVKKALPSIAKVGLIGLAVVAAIPVAAVVLGVAVIAAPALAAGAVVIDPKMVLVVSDGHTTHWVCIFSWLD